MAPQLASSAFPSIAAHPRALRSDPTGVSALYPVWDALLTRPDMVPASASFTRASAGTRYNDQGLLQSVAANVLRIDHDPVTGINLGGLFEEARTNYVLQSSAIISGTALKSPWADAGGLTYKTDGTLGPDGALATLLTANGNADPIVYQNTAFATVGATVTHGVRLKAGSAGFARLDFNFAGAAANVSDSGVVFNLTTGAVVATVGTAPSATGFRLLSGGFILVWISTTVPSGTTSTRADLRPYTSATTATGSLYHGGTQIEPGAFPTSYVPTGAAAASRVLDGFVAPVTSDWFNPNEGTLYVDTFMPDGFGSAGFAGLMVFDDGTSNNLLGVYLNNDGSVHVQNGAGGKYPDLGSGPLGLAAGASIRIAVSYTATTLTLAVNGLPPVSVAIGSGGLASGLAFLRVGNWWANSAPFSGRIRRAAWLPRVPRDPLISSAELLRLMSESLPISLPLATTNRPGLMSSASVQALVQAVSDLAIAQQNVLFQGLLIAALRNVPTGLVDGILDPFSSTADINTGSSSGYTFSSGAGTIGATVNSGAALQSTSYAIADSSYSGEPATNAFDGNVSSVWGSSLTGTSVSGAAWIGQDFGSGNAKSIGSASITQDTSSQNQITSALLQYADSPSGPWTTVATVALSGSTKATTSVPSSVGAHRCWRYLANANSSNGWNIAEITLNAPSSIVVMTLQSATLASAVASPSAMRALIQVDSTSATFTANTDLIVKLSRDGGTTFTTATLGLVQSMPDGTVIYDTGWLSVTGQPAGNSTMTYLITTPTAKAIVLTGVSMQVRP